MTNSTETMNIKLASAPGVPNANGVVYQEECYRKAIEDYKKVIGMGSAVVHLGIPNWAGGEFKNDITTACAHLVEIKDGEAVIRPMKNENGDVITKHYEGKDISLAMNYYGFVGDTPIDENGVREVKDIRIASFSVIPTPPPFGSEDNKLQRAELKSKKKENI